MTWLRTANDPIKKSYDFSGIPIRIEWPKGSTRTWKNSDYKRLMKCDYGYIGKTEGNDGEEVDVYVGPGKSSKKVFEITQLKKDNETYDEDKFMLGFHSEDEAVEAYLQHMDPEHFGGITELSWDEFEKMVRQNKKETADADI